jgi:hypothetical protein
MTDLDPHSGGPVRTGAARRNPAWPTLVTLNPIAHAGLHVAAVLHSYDTEPFLPPHG